MKFQEGDSMILRAILGTLVMVFFIIPFMRRIQQDRREGQDTSKWNYIFVIMAVVLWIFMIASVIVYYS
jgi:hypothetical protein